MPMTRPDQQPQPRQIPIAGLAKVGRIIVAMLAITVGATLLGVWIGGAMLGWAFGLVTAGSCLWAAETMGDAR